MHMLGIENQNCVPVTTGRTMLVEVSSQAGSSIWGCFSAACSGWQMNLVWLSSLQTRLPSAGSAQPSATLATCIDDPEIAGAGRIQSK